MIVGVPKEIKVHEYRVGLVPAAVRELTSSGHEVVVQAGAGDGIGVDDTDYQAVGASILPTADAVFDAAQMIVKVKEPQAVERKRLKPGHLLFTYLHLAPDPDQTRDLIDSGATCVAYETVTGRGGGLPLLAPMSEVAGRLSIQAGAHFLEKAHGGLGLLLGGVPGVPPAKVVIIGGGMVGTHAAAMAVGLEAEVWVLDRNVDALRRLWQQFGSRINTEFSTRLALETHCADADLVIGGVLIPGAAAPKLVDRQILKTMRNGSVVVDVAIDQGGCFETSRPTTHDDPVFIEEGVIHYCVANMPGGVPRTSTYALNNATLPFVIALANHGVDALKRDEHLRAGLNVMAGKVTCEPVAIAQNLPYVSAEKALGMPT
ncbi:MAG: alanine dehydrogenase [Burkholderiaceae bacterium]